MLIKSLHHMNTIEIFAIYMIVLMLFFLMVVFLAIAVGQIIYLYHKHYHKIIRSQVTQHLEKLVANQAPFNEKSFKRKWRKLDQLVPVLRMFDQKYGGRWQSIREELVKCILVPLARQNTYSENWILRYYSAEAFCYYATIEDELYIHTLLNDKVPLIYLNALMAAVKHPSTSTIGLAISKIVTESRLTRTLYIQAFENGPLRCRQIVETLMSTYDSADQRTVCYMIFLHFPSFAYAWNIEKDLHSQDTDLKTATIRFVTHCEGKRAIPLLLDLLHDPKWEVKNVAIRSLGVLKATDQVDEIAHCLNDPNLWVSLAAAQTLNSLGEQGRAILEAQNSNSINAYQSAHYVLGLQA